MATIDIAVADMAGVVDAFPVGLNPDAGWSKGAAVQMGRRPSGQAAPNWWPGPSWAFSDTTWTRMQGWWYVNVTANSVRANNGLIQVRNVANYIQRDDTGAWVQIGITQDPGAEYYPEDGSGAPTGGVEYRTGDPGGGKSFRFDENPGNKNIHGYGVNSNISAYMGNIRNVMITIEARLIKDDPGGVDDLDNMRLLCMAGGDYYPDSNTSNGSMGVDYNPGIGCGRFKWLTREWQIFCFWPSRNARGGAGVDNNSVLSASDKTRTETEFRTDNPPTFTLDVGTVPDAYTIEMLAQAYGGSVIPVRVVAGGAPVVGATLTWEGNNGGIIYGTTNAAGIATVRLGGPGTYTLRATSGSIFTTKSIIVQTPPAIAINKSGSPENITVSPWTTEGSGNVRTADNVADIYGTTKFDTFQQGTGTPALNQQYSGFDTIARIVALSRFLKRGSHDWVSLRMYFGALGSGNYATVWFNLATGEVGSVQTLGTVALAVGKIENWGNGIYRCIVEAQGSPTGGQMASQMRIDSADWGFVFPSGASVGVGADQINDGAVLPYVPNAAASAVAPVVQAKTLLPAINGQAYEDTITCTGTQPITWSLASGQLPTGLSANFGQTSMELSITGTCTDTQNRTFSIKALNSAGEDTESFTINVAALDTPAQPVATVINSDTMSLAVSGIDADATHVDVWAKVTLPIAGDWALVGRFPKADFPKQITDLQVAATYEFKVQAATTLTVSAESPVSAAKKLYRLFVYGHVAPSAQGVTGVKYQVGPLLAADEVWPASSFAKGTGNFDGSLVTFAGNSHARLVVELSAQPTSGKIRHGEDASMLITKAADGKSTPVLQSTVQVIEGP